MLRCCKIAISQLDVNSDANFCLKRSDATAGWTTESKDATVQYSWPAFAHQILDTQTWLKTLEGEGS
jgi:hypothetical protein